MSHQVKWTRRITDLFVYAAQLNDLERQVLETRISGMSIRQQAYYFNVSESTINRIVQRLKQKYDVVQKEYPDDLPVRQKKSVYEEYLDKN